MLGGNDELSTVLPNDAIDGACFDFSLSNRPELYNVQQAMQGQ